MAHRHPRVTRESIDDHSVDPGKKVRKTALKGITTAAVLASLIVGSTFSGPADIIDDQEAANYRPAPIVMDVDEYVNAPGQGLNALICE